MSTKSNRQQIPIAIIGIGCFFPKSIGLKGYWRLLSRGQDGISDVPPTHWSPDEYFDPDPKAADRVYCQRGGFLPQVSFDPTEWGIPPNALDATDTSQLLALVAAKMALADAGYAEGRPFNRDRTSVILGVTGAQELVIPLGARLGFPKWRRALESAGIPAETAEAVIQRISSEYVGWKENSFPGLLGNVVAGRISNRLNLSGTNCVVDAACASSISAIHLAALELITHRSDMILTGGVDTFNDIFMHMCFAKTNILSASGDAKPFSARADGTVLGEGVGILVMKRLSDAERDGDRIYAVIRGLGTASDGKSQSIYAPRAEGQAKALRNAYASAGIDPATVRLIEAHGTGTRVGDAVEFKALKSVFDSDTLARQTIALGSVKSMIGHTKAAAGSAGLIKIALSLYHKVLPPTLKADPPDPKLEIEKSPFFLNNQLRPWLSDSAVPRRAGISSFGFGGSNYHAVLEEYQPQKADPSWDQSVDIFAFSAPSTKELSHQLQQLKQTLQNTVLAAQIHHAAAQSRHAFRSGDQHRLLICAEVEHMSTAGLAKIVDRAITRIQAAPSSVDSAIIYGSGQQIPKIAFVFPGQGSQYTGMGRELICCFPEALQILESADTVHQASTRLGDVIIPPTGMSQGFENQQRMRLNRTDWAQPAIGVISLAMLKVLGRFGVEPDYTCGHSFGELTALHAAGCYTDDTFLQLAFQRGQLMAAANASQTGAMLAINAPLKEIGRMINEYSLDLVLANRNGPTQAVLSGAADVVAEAEKLCQKLKFNSFPLPVSAAFHSPLMAAAQEPFRRFLDDIAIALPQIPVYSNTTGEPYPDTIPQIRDRLGEHLLQPVNFMSEIENLYHAGVHTFVEVGPKTVLTGLIQSILEGRRFNALALDRSKGRQNGLKDLALVLCRLASAGYPVKLNRWERPSTTLQLPKMQIAVSGANLWQPPPPETASTQTVALETEADHNSSDPNHPSQPINPLDPMAYGHQTKMKKSDTPQTISPTDSALSVIQEGLKSLQALQQQTAETHQKFLDTQKEASRALQAMLTHTQQLADAPAHSAFNPMDAQNPMSPQSAKDSTKKDKAAVEAPSDRSPVIPDASLVADQTVDEADNQDTAATSHPMPSLSLPSTKMADTLLGVVSELTGYPVEMIDLDMDIEADLGIDSIKRVEILSTLEEKIPDLPLIPPDELGSLKTLNQILAFLSEKTGIFDSVPIPEAEEPSHKLPANEQAMSGSPKADELRNRVLQVVSELTGYPVEMIGADMDMEADLGIDSIKRVEILSILEEKYADLPVVPPETLGSLKTLEEIVAVLAGANVENHKAGMDVAAPASAEETPCGHRHPQATIDLSQIDRHRVTVVEQTPLESKPITLAADRKVFITDDKSGLSKAIADELSEHEINSVLISPDILEYKSELPSAAGLLLVCGPDTDLGSEDIKTAFGLAKHVAPALKDAAKNGGALFGAVVRLDGGFGFRTGAIQDPFQGAFAGLVKTAALEWESVTCRVIDVAPSWHDPYAAAKAIVPELLGDDKPASVEVGLDADGRYALTLDPISYAANPEIDLALETDSVMVVSGGARGITAANVLALTRHCKPTIVLLGRSAAPTDEPSWLAGLQDEARIKAAILQHEFSHPPPSPAELETVYRRYLANREIADNLDAFKRQNIAVHYFCVDVRDDARVKEILNRVRRQYGPIRALIHGAGVVEDRLIEEKSTAQFGNVFDTKVIGLQSLLAAVGNDELRYLVLYSSVAARFGNRGQADYAMANEVLNKIASREAARRPACKVVSINWGPWDGGMVTTALKREFKRRGIDLISMDTGAQCLAAEMSHPDHRLVEVIVGQALGAAKPVIGRASDAPSTGASTPLNPPDQSLFISFQRDVDLDRYPIVGDHQLNGKPVIPLALITEWFGHGALHENPGLYLHGIDDMRVLQGIKIEADKRQIRLLAGKAKKSDDFFKVALELRNGHRNGTDIVHSKATAILTDTVVHPPQYRPTLPDTFLPYPRDIQEVYDKILFHGQLLHGIQRILHLDQNGIIAFVAAAPPPSAWLKEPLRNTWITDPLILDSAFQMASVWCYEHMGMVSLPSYCGSYRQYTRRFPSEGVTAVLEVDNTRRNKMTGRFTFLDDEQKVLAQLSGYEAVVDPSLYRAFKPDLVVNA